MELVSVIVVTYNSSETVVETLESIYNQTYENVELVVTDDNSTDDTANIVNRWIDEKGSRFFNVIFTKTEKNCGVVGNNNNGIRHSNGKYIQLIAGDDILLPDCLKIKMHYAEKENSNIVFTKVDVFGNNVKMVNDTKRSFERGLRLIESGWEKQNECIVRKNFFASVCGTFIKKEFVMSVGLFDERFPMLEDYPFFYKYILAGNKIKIHDEKTILYRVRASSLCNAQKKHPLYIKSYYDFFFKERLWVLIKRKEFKVIRENIIEYLDDKINI